MYVDVDEFEAQMEFIKNFYHPISETDIIHSVNNRENLPDYSIWITFDDGWKDNYQNACRVLLKFWPRWYLPGWHTDNVHAHK